MPPLDRESGRLARDGKILYNAVRERGRMICVVASKEPVQQAKPAVARERSQRASCDWSAVGCFCSEAEGTAGLSRGVGAPGGNV